MRSSESGYVLAAMNDPTGRRGIWYRDPQAAVEICGGREGDDFYVLIEAGQVVTMEQVRALRDILSTGAWMVRDSTAQTEPAPISGRHSK